MKSRSSTWLTMFALGLAAAALAPKIVKALAAWKPAVATPTPVPARETPAPAPQPAPVAQVIAASAPVVAEDPPVAEPEPPAPAVAAEPPPAASPVEPTPIYPWLQSQPALAREPAVPPADPVQPQATSQWSPGPVSPPPAHEQPAYRPSAEAVPWRQGYQPPVPGPYSLPQTNEAVSLGWAPPGTYRPPTTSPIPFPAGGYRPPTAGFAQAAQAESTFSRPPAGVASFAGAPSFAAAAAAQAGAYADFPAEFEFDEALSRRSWRHWAGTVSSLLGILLLITVVATLVFVAVAPRALGWQFVVVSGGSMEPTIHLGAVAVMTKVDAKALKVGDIIMFTDPNQPNRAVTHRIIEVKDNGANFVTRGDANKSADQSTVPAANVHGKFLFSVPAAGRFVRWMGTSQGYLAIILVPGIVIIFWELRSLSKNRKPSGAVGA